MWVVVVVVERRRMKEEEGSRLRESNCIEWMETDEKGTWAADAGEAAGT